MGKPSSYFDIPFSHWSLYVYLCQSLRLPLRQGRLEPGRPGKQQRVLAAAGQGGGHDGLRGQGRLGDEQVSKGGGDGKHTELLALVLTYVPFKTQKDLKGN